MIADTRMLDPVAERMLNEKTAASACGAATTGGMRRTTPSSHGTCTCGAYNPLSHALLGASPHTNTMTQSKTHGTQCWMEPEGFSGAVEVRRHRKYIESANTDDTPATTSTSHGP